MLSFTLNLEIGVSNLILIIEDDEHKSSQILDLIGDSFRQPGLACMLIDNVRDAVLYLKKEVPSKIILDMSLPSHKALPGQGTPVPLPTGGIEILFELRKKGLRKLPILVLTQYPEIEVESEPYPVEEAANVISELYGFTNIAAFHYDQLKANEWKRTALEFLRK